MKKLNRVDKCIKLK